MGTASYQMPGQINRSINQRKNQIIRQNLENQLISQPKTFLIQVQEPGEQLKVIELTVADSNLTCGWLLSEVIRRHQKRATTKIPIVCLKTLSCNELIDSLLLMYDRSIQPLFDGETLQAVFAQKVQKDKIMSHFKPIKVIGKGGFSKVIQVRKKDTGKIYALKIINKEFIIQKGKVSQIMRERRIIEKLNNEPFNLQVFLLKRQELFLVLDFCPGGEFFFHLHNLGRLTEEQSKFYFAEIVLGLEHIHNNDIVYRDLKPENILLDLEGHIKLTDFGLSIDNMQRNKKSYSFCGSPEYMSPEMLKGTGHSKSVDFYSLGALLYEMLTGLPPFYNQNYEIMHQNIQQQDIKFPPFISKQAKSLITQLLIKEPEKRMGSLRGVQEIKDHP